MNSILGNLASYRLPLLVPALFESDGLSGSLKMRRGGVRRAFGIEAGKLTFESSTDPREHLAQLLVDQGVLDLWSAVNAFDDARREGVPFGEWLVKRSLAAAPVVREVLVQKARDAFFDCY